jgi:hypothetical protein
MFTQTVYLSYQKKTRVFMLSYDEAKNDPSALQAMEDEIASFKRFDCYEEVSSDLVSAKANIFSTRWDVSKKMNDDGTWRSKASLVARGYEDKEKDRLSSDSPIASSATQRLVLALLAKKQWIQTLGTLQEPFCKVSSSLVTFLSCRRLTLLAAMLFAFEGAYLWHRVGSEVLVRSANRSLSGIWIYHSHYRRRPPYHDEC